VRTRHVIVLAAGKGTRMRARRPKVLHRLAGQTLIERVLRSADALSPASTTLVVGHESDLIRAALAHHPHLQYVVQEPQLGTAHALLQGRPVLEGASGSLVVLSGDVPRLGATTLTALLDTHEHSGNVATVLTTTLERPYGYGRVLRSEGDIVGIVEETDATAEQRKIGEVNSGIYVFAIEPLFDALTQIPEAGPKRERYLPAIVPMYRRQGLPVGTFTAADPNEIRGINSQTELAEMSTIVRQSKNEELMAAGVSIDDPATTYIDDDVSVGADTVIHPGVTLEGHTTVGERCEVHSGVRVVNSVLGDDVTVRNHCVITDSHLASGAQVGPFAHLRPGSVLESSARVGNFVELKKTTLGSGSKANHLSYIGDSTVGKDVNIGAGTITCNYDGTHKHQTTLEDGVFVGSGTQLVAPITVAKDAYVAAGSCITKDVPPGAMAVARGRQVNKPGWMEKRRKSE
jgi:bifunctional UDP-N-acetylglucosamine pyrophosphorylase/glucosamine-1-phosphate N-acetyltransferase